MENAIRPNVAYGASSHHQREENVYDNPQLQDMPPADCKITEKHKRILPIAGCALVLAILALLAAAIAIYLGAHTSQDYFQNISTLQKMNQILQDATVTNFTSILMKSRGTFWNPATSCSDILPGSPSGDYWIQTNRTSNPVQVYCDMNQISCSCNTTAGWMRVANLDMTDSNQNCPAGFRLVTRTSAPLRTCGRPGPAGCVSTTFQTYGVEYSHVCGRVIGYQDRTPDAFGQIANISGGTTIDSFYVDGVSLTHGQSPRQHIWTFAGAIHESTLNRIASCPCTQPDLPKIGMIPSFVGLDYFCDTGSGEVFQHIFHPDDPLWDGQGCGGNSTCCKFNNPPWFCRQLPQPTTNDIELRICGDEPTDNEDTPIEQVEIYILKSC